MNAVGAAWLAEIAFIVIRDFAGPKRPPLPSELLATFVVFGALGVIAGNGTARRPAVAAAWGLVVATALSAKVDFLKPVGDFLSGGTGAGSVPLEQSGIAGGATAQGQVQTNIGAVSGADLVSPHIAVA